MNAYIPLCEKCKRQLGHSRRKKLAMLRETAIGFSSAGFALCLCDRCANAAKHTLSMWIDENRRKRIE